MAKNEPTTPAAETTMPTPAADAPGIEHWPEEVLIKGINEQVREADRIGRAAGKLRKIGKDAQIRAGKLLNEAQRRVGKDGDWTPWLRDHVKGFNAAMKHRCERYMKRARESEKPKPITTSYTDGQLIDLDNLVAEPGEENKPIITKPGDLIILGNHRLLCGDSGSAADVDRLLIGTRIDLVNTDPPYNVSVLPRSNAAIADRDASNADGVTEKLRANDRPILNDTVSEEDYKKMLRAWLGNIAHVLKPGGACYIWGGYKNFANYPSALKESGLYFSQLIVWDKQWPVMTRLDFLGAVEFCFYGWRERKQAGTGHKFYGTHDISNLWRAKKHNPQNYIHLTQKPCELAINAIEYSSLPGEAVLDLFGGSGSTLIACEVTGRRCFMMEKDEWYCDKIVESWERVAKRKAWRVPQSDEDMGFFIASYNYDPGQQSWVASYRANPEALKKRRPAKVAPTT